MPGRVAIAVVHEDPPQVFVADDQDTLNWVLALQLIARMSPDTVGASVADELRRALREERWGDAVVLWMESRRDIAVDVYSSHELYEASDVAMAAHELQFTPLFRD